MKPELISPDEGACHEVVRVWTLRQPWAWIIVHGGKRIENRKQRQSYRGPVLIHSSAVMTRAEYEDARAFAEDVWTTLYGVDDPRVNQLPAHDSPELLLGHIVGRAVVSSVVRPHAGPEDGRYPKDVAPEWHMKEQFGHVLRGVEPVTPVPWRGGLGLVRAPLARVEMLLPGTRAWIEKVIL